MKNSESGLFKGPLSKVICVALGLCLVVFAAVWIRAFYASRHAYQEAEEYLRKQQDVRAITFLDRSIHWYAPLNPYVYRSAERLWEMCTQAEQDGDIELALIAVRTIRRGFLAARSFYTPGKEWIDRCNVKIALLMDRESDAQIRGDANVAFFPLQASRQPDVFWTLVTEVGLIGWICAVIGFLVHSLSRHTTPKRRSGSGLIWGIMVLVFYTMWILGMMRS